VYFLPGPFLLAESLWGHIRGIIEIRVYGAKTQIGAGTRRVWAES